VTPAVALECLVSSTFEVVDEVAVAERASLSVEETVELVMRITVGLEDRVLVVEEVVV